MLPYLKPKNGTGSSLIVQTRSPDGGTKVDDAQPEGNQGMEACAEDILRAIAQKDAKHLAEALQALFDIADSQPHEEGPHTNHEDNQ